MKPDPRPGVRLQKFLADRGLGSRRRLEDWITEGRIRVDGKPAELGQRVTEDSRISIDGRPLRGKTVSSKTRVLLYNKPEGEICTRDDPRRRPTVFRKLPRLRGERWVIVGRLDINTRGLLLFTNNGELANQLMHPSSGIQREYLCRVFGEVSEADIKTLQDGVVVDGQEVAFSEVKRQRGEGRNTWYRVGIAEGKNREVRRIWEAVGGQVSRLVRVSYGGATLPRNLRQGEFIELRPDAISGLIPDGSWQETAAPEATPKASRSRKTERPPKTTRKNRGKLSRPGSPRRRR